MADTPIEWTDVTWNPVRGCARVSPGCEHCYAERVAHRFSGKGGKYEGLTVMGKKGPRWSGEARFVPEKLAEPLSWKKPRRVFVNSMSDLAHEAITFDQMAAVVGVIAATPWNTYQILTKRIERWLSFFTWLEVDRDPNRFRHPEMIEHAACVAAASDKAASDRLFAAANRCAGRDTWPLSNLWLGVSCEDQQRADERIPLLLRCPAAVRFVSAEPLLGPIDFGTEWLTTKLGRYPFPDLEEKHRTRLIHLLDWVIVGGESGLGARSCDVAWIRSIVEQCKAARTACFVKQLGRYWIENRGREAEAVGGRARPFVNAARITEDGTVEREVWPTDRKGGDPAEWPEAFPRQFPEVRCA